MPVSVKRVSDGQHYAPAASSPNSSVKSLKDELRQNFPPAVPNGCRLKFNGKVMKSRHHLSHYKVADDAVIEMDDSKNWSSSSSSSNST